MNKRGIKRPADAERSLAIYHTEKQNNQYKTGKIAHIYRPIAHDANGHSVFCDFKELKDLTDGQEHDLSKGLTVVVPQKFLTDAAYPVTVDPTFGYTTAGASFLTTAWLNIFALVATGPTGGGTGNSMSAYIDFSGLTAGTGKYQMALYRASDGVLIAQTTESTGNSDFAAQWKTLNFTTSPSLSGISYWLAYNCTGTGGNYGSFNGDIYYDSGSAVYKSNTYASNSWPNPLTGTTADVEKFSIYVTYTGPLLKTMFFKNSQPIRRASLR
jgi:hypothetical protein